jgi:transposase InsO family protein
MAPVSGGGQHIRTHVWAYDFVMDRTQDGRPVKMLTMVDEYTRESLAITVRRRMRATEVQEVLGEWFVTHGCPVHIRSDNVLYPEVKSHKRKNLRSAALGSCETIPLLPSQWASTS